MQIDAGVLKAQFNRGADLHAAILRYIYVLLSQISQSAVCHHFHSVEQRLACLAADDERTPRIKYICINSGVFGLSAWHSEAEHHDDRRHPSAGRID